MVPWATVESKRGKRFIFPLLFLFLSVVALKCMPQNSWALLLKQRRKIRQDIIEFKEAGVVFVDLVILRDCMLGKERWANINFFEYESNTKSKCWISISRTRTQIFEKCKAEYQGQRINLKHKITNCNKKKAARIGESNLRAYLQTRFSRKNGCCMIGYPKMPSEWLQEEKRT